ncbi:hypothetical protein [Marinicella sp. W31]|uniref:hypothetical protein n=1 Tax=Marinicella sp. W31 TaxID=3023713 RepID=UPI003757176C
MKIFISLMILTISQLTMADPDPISVDWERGKNCYHNGDWYTTVEGSAPCPSFVPLFVGHGSSAIINSTILKLPHSKAGAGTSGGYWTHIGGFFFPHRPGDPDCLITWDQND